MSAQRTISNEPKWHDYLWFGGMLEELVDGGRVSRGEARLMLRAQQKRRIWRDSVFWLAMLPAFWGWIAAFAAMRPADWMPRDLDDPGPVDWLALFALGLVAPFLLMMVIGFTPWWLHRREARRLAATPACFACTYDLSGAPADAPPICTECGFIAPHMRSRASDGVSDAPRTHSLPTEQSPIHPP